MKPAKTLTPMREQSPKGNSGKWGMQKTLNPNREQNVKAPVGKKTFPRA